jgi:hypothetical protein
MAAKNEEYVDLICRTFCTYYKEGREDLLCGTFSFLRRNLTPGELRELIGSYRASGIESSARDSRDDEVKEIACEECDFLIDGCEFRDDRSGPPCGGYAVVEMLLG